VTPAGRAREATRPRTGAREAVVRAQAKINLYLRVLAREDGGYHQIETLFQRLALGDRVRVRVGPAVEGRTLDCRGPALPAAGLGPAERNLAWRAAVTYAEATGWPDAFAIEVEKEVPVGGGLGGGSADAGAVLRCLNALAPEPLAGGELLALAATLGADVPFLTSEAPLALAWGRGERMLALPSLPERRVHLACFAEGRSHGAGVRGARRVAARVGRACPPDTVDGRPAHALGRRGAGRDQRLRARGAAGSRGRGRRAAAVRRRGAAGRAAQRPRRAARRRWRPRPTAAGRRPRADRAHVGVWRDGVPPHAARRRRGRIGGGGARRRRGHAGGARGRDADRAPRCPVRVRG
jgi:hypothetical protein